MNLYVQVSTIIDNLICQGTCGKLRGTQLGNSILGPQVHDLIPS